jgi:hypothetical protein
VVPQEPHVPKLNGRVPQYRHHKASGQGVVTLDGQDHYCGPYRDSASKIEYDRIVAIWLANGRRAEPGAAEKRDISVNELIVRFWDHADGSVAREVEMYRLAVRPLIELFGETSVNEFGPLRLKVVRTRMIGLCWCRNHINHQVSRLKSMFCWGTEEELVAGTIYHALQAVKGLRRGRGDPLPFGLNDLEGFVQRDPNTGKVKCVVRSCGVWLQPPTRAVPRGDVCPEHGIQVHTSGTFSYADYRRNLTVDDAAYFHQHIRYHPFKYECHRFGQEKSEDALSFNVFRSFQRAGCLKSIVTLCTGIETQIEPLLLLWGLELQPSGVEPWKLLIEARNRFESDLPVDRPKTEPDIILFHPGRYVILIEAKFTSPNGVYERNRRPRDGQLTLNQLLNIYTDEQLRILDYAEAGRRDRVHYQLWRNMIFAEWMAGRDASSTRAYHANLVRQGHEECCSVEFLGLLRPEYRDRFRQITWEQLCCMATRQPEMGRCCTYIRNKTAGLKPAFRLETANRRLGRLLEKNWRAGNCFQVNITAIAQPSAKAKLLVSWTKDQQLKHALCGCYLLRTNLPQPDPVALWRQYIQLVDAEWAFRISKDELELRPVWHQHDGRVQGHILVCFIAYAMWKTLGGWMAASGLGGSSASVGGGVVNDQERRRDAADSPERWIGRADAGGPVRHSSR